MGTEQTYARTFWLFRAVVYNGAFRAPIDGANGMAVRINLSLGER